MKHPNLQPDVSRIPHHDRLPGAVVYLWSHMVMFEEAWQLVQAIQDWPGVAIAPDRHGLLITLDAVPLGHLRWNGRVDLPFAPDVGDRLIAEGMVSRDPDHRDTGRVVFDVRSAADVDRAVWLLRLAFLNADSKGDAIPNLRRRPLFSNDGRAPFEEPHA